MLQMCSSLMVNGTRPAQLPPCAQLGNNCSVRRARHLFAGRLFWQENGRLAAVAYTAVGS